MEELDLNLAGLTTKSVKDMTGIELYNLLRQAMYAALKQLEIERGGGRADYVAKLLRNK